MNKKLAFIVIVQQLKKMDLRTGNNNLNVTLAGSNL